MSNSLSEAEDSFSEIVDESEQLFRQEKLEMDMLSQKLFFNAKNNIALANDFLLVQQLKLKNSAENCLKNATYWLQQKEDFIKWNNPQTIINRGFSLTLKDGKIVRSINQLQKGDLLKTLLSDGEKESIVK